MLLRFSHAPGFVAFTGLAAILMLAVVPPAGAGGTPENLLLLIDPSNADSLYVGNYYMNARQIPACNVIYMSPGATDYSRFADINLDELFGSLTQAGLYDHIDYIVTLPGAPFYVSAPGLVSDSCSPVTRFSISGAYTMAFISNEVLTGTLNSQNANRFYSLSTPRNFDSEITWLGGVPSTSASARRYFIGAMLGYDGSNGNPVADTIAMIDRSVAVDGTRPTGTFYFMNNTADPARNVRSGQFSAAVNAIIAAGGQAQVLNGILPGKHDCLGIMTGAADPAIDTTDETILSGAFCDHLTSWAATFDIDSQVKVSRWIANDASGSWGEVEEPCNYTGKFPHARTHYCYFLGCSLGEAVFRNIGYTPFQGLLYGDPMTRPFAYIPSVNVADAPTDPVSGTIALTPTASTANPSAQIASFDLLVDGRQWASITAPGAFALDTTKITDGWHDLRVIAYDNTAVKSAGRWLGQLTVNNQGRSVSASITPASGDPTTPFAFAISASGAAASEVRVVQNGRVLAAGPGSAASLTVHGLIVGGGPAQVQVEALFPGDRGAAVAAAPTTLDVATTGGTPSGQPPVAYSFTKSVYSNSPFVLELPATFDNPAVPLTYEIITGPAQATIPAGQAGPYRLVRPNAGAHGTDTVTFRVTSASGNSDPATATIVYTVLGDLNCDGAVNAFDIDPFVLALVSSPSFDAYYAAYPDCDPLLADVNRDHAVNAFDIDPFVLLLTGG